MSLPTKATLSIFPPPPFSSSLQTFACSFSCCRYRNFFLQASAFHSAHPTPLPVVVANGGGVGDPTPLSFLLSKAGPPPSRSLRTHTWGKRAGKEFSLSLSIQLLPAMPFGECVRIIQRSARVGLRRGGRGEKSHSCSAARCSRSHMHLAKKRRLGKNICAIGDHGMSVYYWRKRKKERRQVARRRDCNFSCESSFFGSSVGGTSPVW